MDNQSDIKRFVKHTLGCSCPDEVFEKIESRRCSDLAGTYSLTIGDRLLIYVVKLQADIDLEPLLDAVLEAGVAERDKRSLNRFRMVLVSPAPEPVRIRAEQVFSVSKMTDERTHLHVVSESQAKALMR